MALCPNLSTISISPLEADGERGGVKNSERANIISIALPPHLNGRPQQKLSNPVTSLFCVSATEVSVFFMADQRSKGIRLTKHLKSQYQKRKGFSLRSSREKLV